MTITFTTKETYLQWRSDWKARYKLISQNIRDLKMLKREHSRAWTVAKKETGDRVLYSVFYERVHTIMHAVPGYDAAAKRVQRLGIESQRDEARTMLFVLDQAKQEAQRQYLAAHAAVVPA